MDNIFENNPKVDLYYKTSDDNAFFSKNAAQNHASTLSDKDVKKVTRSSASKETLDTEPAGDGTEQGVKLTPKQQLQADYELKFGEVPAEEFTKNQISEAIEKGEKLVVEPKKD